VVEFVGLAARLKPFADVEQGEAKIYYTRIPNLASDHLEFKKTGTLFVLYDLEDKGFAVAQKLPNKRLGTVFLVNSSGEIISYDDSVDPSAFLKKFQVDGTVKYIVRQASPVNIEEYVNQQAEKIVRELEKCGVESAVTSRTKDGQDINGL